MSQSPTCAPPSVFDLLARARRIYAANPIAGQMYDEDKDGYCMAGALAAARGFLGHKARRADCNVLWRLPEARLMAEVIASLPARANGQDVGLTRADTVGRANESAGTNWGLITSFNDSSIGSPDQGRTLDVFDAAMALAKARGMTGPVPADAMVDELLAMSSAEWMTRLRGYGGPSLKSIEAFNKTLKASKAASKALAEITIAHGALAKQLGIALPPTKAQLQMAPLPTLTFAVPKGGYDLGPLTLQTLLDTKVKEPQLVLAP